MHTSESQLHYSEREQTDYILHSPVRAILVACGTYRKRDEAVTREDFVRYREEGDPEAKERLILHNLGLVVKRAKEIHDHNDTGSYEMSDLIQSGVPGLIKAVEKYDPDYIDENGRKAQFSTYAWYGIGQSIARSLANESSMVRLPVHIRDKYRAQQRTYTFLREQLGRTPTDEEVGKELGITGEAIKELHQSTLQPLSLDRYVGKDEDGESIWLQRYDMENPEWIKDQEAVESSDRASSVRALRDEVLDDREAAIIDARYGLSDDVPQTFEVVGARFDVTRERIRQIEIASLGKMADFASHPSRQDQFDVISPSRAERRAAQGTLSPYVFPATMADFAALDAREYTKDRVKRRAILAEAAATRRSLEKRAAEVDERYETALRDRATGSMFDAAAGRIVTRQEFFKRNSDVSPAVPRILEEGAPRWASFFANQFGMYSYRTMRPIWDAMQIIKRPATLAELQDLAEAKSDHLFDIHPAFIKTLLVMASEQRLVTIDRTDDDRSLVRYAPGIDDPRYLREVQAYDAHSYRHLPSVAQQVVKAMQILSAGDGPDTAITFSQLRNVWAETNSKDIEETQLRRGLEYLKRSGHLGSGKSKHRVNLLWHARPASNIQPTVRLKAHELWYEDKDARGR